MITLHDLFEFLGLMALAFAVGMLAFLMAWGLTLALGWALP